MRRDCARGREHVSRPPALAARRGCSRSPAGWLRAAARLVVMPAARVVVMPTARRVVAPTGRRLAALPTGGAVTAELAIGLIGLAAVVSGLVWGMGVVTTYQRCADAAREGARAAGRGEPPGEVRALVSSLAPFAEVSITAASERLPSVTVTVRARPPSAPLAGLAGISAVSASATALLEGSPWGGEHPR